MPSRALETKADRPSCHQGRRLSQLEPPFHQPSARQFKQSADHASQESGTRAASSSTRSCILSCRDQSVAGREDEAAPAYLAVGIVCCTIWKPH